MAGGWLRFDPAIEKWAVMRETTPQHFRFTHRNLVISLVFCVVVPGGLYFLADRYQGNLAARWHARTTSARLVKQLQGEEGRGGGKEE